MEEIQYEIGGVACFAFRKKSGFETVCNELFYGCAEHDACLLIRIDR